MPFVREDFSEVVYRPLSGALAPAAFRQKDRANYVLQQHGKQNRSQLLVKVFPGLLFIRLVEGERQQLVRFDVALARYISE